MPDRGSTATRRVGFDALRALHNTTGLGNYSRGVLHALRRLDPSLDIQLYAPLPPAGSFADFAPSLRAPLHLPVGRIANLLEGRLWRSFRLGRSARRDGVQLYHGLSHEIPRDLPRCGIRSVVTFHDLIFEHHPEYFPRLDRWSYRWRYRWSARNADAVIGVSGRTCDDLLHHYHIDPARVTVVPPPRDDAFTRSVPDTERARARIKYGLPGEFMLSVGTLEARKNHAVLLAALAILNPRRALPLVLVGRDGGSAAALQTKAAELGLDESRVRLLHDVTAADLPAVVQSSSLFLYPSVVEGFGMPIVEALTCGVPVIAASGGHLDDAGGPGTRYADPHDPTTWALAITETTEDLTRARAMSATGMAWAERFDGAVVASRLLAIYDAVLDRRALPGEPLATEGGMEPQP